MNIIKNAFLRIPPEFIYYIAIGVIVLAIQKIISG